MKPYVLPLFLLNFVSFLLIVLITFSVPFTSGFYFLQAQTTGGLTRFGLLGWQETPSGASAGPQIGYYAPQLTNWLTYSLVLIPTSGILCLFSLLTLAPQITNRHEPLHPNYRTYNPYEAGTYMARSTSEALFSWTTYANMFISLAAFVFSLALFVGAHERFRQLGASDSGGGAVDNADLGDGLQYGPCLWMQATGLVVVLLTPVIRVASRVWGEKRLERLESAALGRQSMWKV